MSSNNLPTEFRVLMHRILQSEMPAFEHALSQNCPVSIRANSQKASTEEFSHLNISESVPWCPDGYYLDPNSDDAYQLALSQLAVTDLDILSSGAALQYLSLVYVLKHDGGRSGLKSVYDTINGESESNGYIADMMLEQAKTLRFMQAKI